MPHDTREAYDGNAQHSSDNTTQYAADNYLRDEVARAVCLRPEAAGHPAAQLEEQLEEQAEGKEYAPGPPVAQPPEALLAAGASGGASADSGLRSVREGVRWHASGLASRPGSVKAHYR